MELSIGKNSPGSVKQLIISHMGADLMWNWTIGDKYSAFEYDVFETINGYWQTLAPLTQDMIFDTYRRIHREFDNPANYNQLSAALRPLVAELVELHPLPDIKYWAETKAGLVVPSSIPRHFDASNSSSWTQERTYLAEDYRELIPMAIATKAIFPIWEEYLFATRSEVGEVWKDYQTFHLISTSSLMHCKPMQRLAVFVNHVIGKDRPMDAAILQGVSTEDFPEWVLASVVVKRLCTGDIRGVDESTTLISYLYNHIVNRARHLESRIAKIKPKTNTEGGGSDEDNNLSKLEGFKIRQEVTAGDIETVSEYIRRSLVQAMNPGQLTQLSLVRRLDPSDDFIGLVQQSIQSTAVLRSERLTKAQVTIAAWVLSEYVPVRSMPHIRKEDVIGVIAFAQAYLWKNGHYDLGAVVGAIAQNSYENELMTIADRRRNMSKEALEEIGKRFPYQIRTSRSRTSKATNKAISSVNELTDELTNYSWTLTIPQPWISAVKKNASDRRYSVHDEIRTKIGELIIELDTRFNKNQRLVDLDKTTQDLPI